MAGGMEEIMLRILMHGQGNMFGRTVLAEYQEVTDQELALTTVYTILGRLENKGFVGTEWVEPAEGSGERRKQRFFIKGEGEAALRELEQQQQRLQAAFPLPLIGLAQDKGVL